MSDPIDVLDFWLGEVGQDGWYATDAVLDAECRARFADVWQAAFDKGLEHWVDGTVGTLAYLVICDQLARNIHRGDAKAFATDPQARDAARLAINNGWDLAAPEPERQPDDYWRHRSWSAVLRSVSLLGAAPEHLRQHDPQ